MKAVVEHLNLWGERFLDFAWPMLWQSSLLIMALFAVDFALRRKVRAAVRYALWLVVILKLVLPPTLALPTSLAWWLRPPPAPKQQTKQYVVTYSGGQSAQSTASISAASAVGELEAPAIKLSPAGWLFAGSVLISAGLLAWMLLRWWQVARLVGREIIADESLQTLLNDVKGQIQIRHAVSLRLTEQPMSPAVCGLFRSVIVFPRLLAEQLPPNQLRAVLLHELVHLKRGDVWVNCLQALLQVVYWWHPLLWLANARIRRVREEAVDDAVMLALRDEAETYAPTLLEVAKLVFRRRLASLGLVGILEPRAALRQRIERLMDLRPPKESGRKIVSVLFILAFAALAVPMERAPQSSPPVVDRTDAPEDLLPQAKVGYAPYFVKTNYFPYEALTLSAITGSPPEEVKPRIVGIGAEDVSQSLFDDFPKSLYDNPPRVRTEYVQKVELLSIVEVREDGSYWIGKQRKTLAELRDSLSQTNHQLRLVIHSNAPLESVRPVRELCETLGVREIDKPAARIENPDELFNRTFKLGSNSFERIWGPKPAPHSGTAVRAFYEELGVDLNPFLGKSTFLSHGKRLLFVRATWDELNKIEQAIHDLDAEEAKAGSETSSAQRAESGKKEAAVLVQDGRLLLELGKLDEARAKLNQAIKLDPKNIPAHYYVRLAEKNDTAEAARRAMLRDQVSLSVTNEFDSQRGGSRTGANAENASNYTALLVRTFKLDPDAFYKGLEKVGSPPVNHTNIAPAMRDFFVRFGVDLVPPKSLFWNDRNGMLLVRATKQDLDIIESAIEALNAPVPQINIKARFVEAPSGAGEKLLAMILTNAPVGGTNGFTGILTELQADKLMNALKSSAGAEITAAPEVTTLSGRQAQVQMVDLKTIVTRRGPVVTNQVTILVPQAETMPFGSVLDVTPHVSPDGYTVQMTLIPTVTEFMGYDDSGNFQPAETPVVPKSAGQVTTTTVPSALPSKTKPSHSVALSIPPLPMPRMRVRQITTTAIVWDGQTIVLGNFPVKEITMQSDGTKVETDASPKFKKQLLVFITPTLVDPAGNRVHPEQSHEPVPARNR